MRYPIIAFTGKQFSGKTTATNIVKNIVEGSGRATRVIKFADPLYDMQNYCYDRLMLTRPKTKDRPLLQFLGADHFRKINKDIFLECFEREVKTSRLFSTDTIILNDDVRYDNEAELITKLGGVIIKVEASEEDRASRGEIIGGNHSSEAGIDTSFIHASLYNTKDVASFEKNVQYLLEIL